MVNNFSTYKNRFFIISCIYLKVYYFSKKELKTCLVHC